MKRMLTVIGLLTVLVISSYAQQPIVKADIPFEFMAAGKVLPAGNYEFVVNEALSGIQIRNLDTHKTMVVHIITQVAARAGTVGVTFDNVNDKRILEAVWPPNGDGYLLASTKGKHGHEVVKAAEKK